MVRFPGHRGAAGLQRLDHAHAERVRPRVESDRGGGPSAGSEGTEKMRNNPPFQNGTIRAKDARIFWDVDSGKVIVVGPDMSAPNKDQFRSSGGACYSGWRKHCNDPYMAKVLCLKAFWNLVYVYEMDPVIVDNALAEIIEYQEAFVVEPGRHF